MIENLGEGGAERVMSFLANEFAKRGYDTSIALLQENPSIVYKLFNDVHVFQVGKKEPLVQERKLLIRAAKKIHWNQLIQLERKRILCKQIDVSRTKPLKEFLKKNNFDVIISFLVKPNIAVIRATNGKGSKVIISERNYPLRDDFPLALLQLKCDSYSKRYDYCVAQTSEILHMLGQKVESRGVIIENPIDDSLPIYTGNLRKHIITNYCTFKPQKNLSMLIRAFAKFSVEFPDYTLELYGKGDRSDLEQLIVELKIENKVSVLPFCACIHEQIKDYAMFVSTSNFEGISNSMIEAMAVGIPTISTDCDGGGARAIIRDHENGILVQKNNEEQLVAAMKEIAKDKNLAKRLSENAVKLRENFSGNRIVQKWVDLIEQ